MNSKLQLNKPSIVLQKIFSKSVFILCDAVSSKNNDKNKLCVSSCIISCGKSKFQLLFSVIK